MPRKNTGPKLFINRHRGGYYYIRWTEQGRSIERSTRTKDFDEAQIELKKQLERSQHSGNAPEVSGPLEPSKVGLMTALEQYAEERGIKTASPERIGYAITALAPFWGHLKASDVRPSACEAYTKFRGVMPGTIRRELGVLKAALNHAYMQRRMTLKIPVELPKKTKERTRYLTRSEAAKLFWEARRQPECRLHLPLFILLGIYTGARMGAILELRFTQIDFEAGKIDFNPPGRDETDKGRAIIPIPRRLMFFLRKAKERSGELGFVVNRNGKQIKNPRRAFNTAARRAGLVDVNRHTLRHTCASWLVQNGVPLLDVAEYLGQSNERTAKLYAHLSPDRLEKARDALNGRPA
jgi:integrase